MKFFIKIVCNFIKKGVKNFVTLLVLLASFLLIYYVKVPSYLIVLGAAFLGTITYFVKNKMKKTVEAEAEDDK